MDKNDNIANSKYRVQSLISDDENMLQLINIYVWDVN